MVGVRMTGSEHKLRGITIDESVHMARAAEQEGLDDVHLTGGCWEAATDCGLPRGCVVRSTGKLVRSATTRPASVSRHPLEAVLSALKRGAYERAF
jgi:hypothetical protein